MVDPTLLVGASLVVIVVGIAAAAVLRDTEPALAVSRPVQALVAGVALGGPFLLEELDVLPAAGGWDIVLALALSCGLFLLAIRLVGVGEGPNHTA